MRLAALGLAFAGSKVASWELPGAGTNRGTLRNYFLLLQTTWLFYLCSWPVKTSRLFKKQKVLPMIRVLGGDKLQIKRTLLIGRFSTWGRPLCELGFPCLTGLGVPWRGFIYLPLPTLWLLGAGVSLVDMYNTFANVSKSNSVHIIMILMGNT